MPIRIHIFCYKLFLGAFIFFVCSSSVSLATSAELLIIDDASLRSQFSIIGKGLIQDGDYTPVEALKEQLSRKTCHLELPRPGKRKLTPAKIYQQRRDSVLILGTLNHCHNPNCDKIHPSLASGVILSRDGIVLTNYHVVASDGPRSITMAAMTADGRSFLVDEVLAADEAADVAIIKLRNAENLSASPLARDEPVGNPATVISHPAGQFFTLTQGVVSRYAKGPDGELIMNITADYARGSSGGPVFNDRGNVIGLVANTKSITYRSVPLAFEGEDDALVRVPANKREEFGGQPLSLGLSHQMTFKNAIASSEVFKLIQ